LAYEHSFGEFYKRFSEATVEIIVARVQPPARIVDFGAGTGRLSIPLSERGFGVTAVDPCQEMLSRLKEKNPRGELRTVCSKMENFSSNEKFDVALCVFTVVIYLLNEESLKRSLMAAHASLRFGGILLIDIPSERIFKGYSRSDHLIKRSVSITNQAGNIFNYREDLMVKRKNGQVSECRDEFLIRYWPNKQVLEALKDTGFVLEEDLSDNFSSTGSNYYIMKKAEQRGALDGSCSAFHSRR